MLIVGEDWIWCNCYSSCEGRGFWWEYAGIYGRNDGIHGQAIIGIASVLGYSTIGKGGDGLDSIFVFSVACLLATMKGYFPQPQLGWYFL